MGQEGHLFLAILFGQKSAARASTKPLNTRCPLVTSRGMMANISGALAHIIRSSAVSNRLHGPAAAILTYDAARRTPPILHAMPMKCLAHAKFQAEPARIRAECLCLYTHVESRWPIYHYQQRAELSHFSRATENIS